MIVGMDFGTTNSGMAVFDGQSLQVLPLDPESPNPRVLRTALYLTNSQNVIIGQQALSQYFEHNLNRPVKMERIWIGEIEVRGGDMHFVTDAYVWTDVLSPGRLFLSIKSSLREADYTGTIIGPFHYTLENLVAIYLYAARLRAERLLGAPLREIVLGRPVRFAFDARHDALAQDRLLDAALRAGYERVYFQYEPIAAATNYARDSGSTENVLVFDFGGGTLDITVMRVNEQGRHRVLATGGLPVAGDVFDQKLIRAKLPPHFGEGSRFGPPQKRLTVPHWIYDSLANWQTILDLQTPENKAMLEEIAATSERPRDIRALASLVSSNYGVRMFEIIEQSKRQLSERIGTMIKLDGPDFQMRQLVTRGEFEAIINPEIKAIDAHVDETLAKSGLRPNQIDAVIRTGGSAQIPVFIRMLAEKFGEEKIRAIDTFSSVTGGLGIISHEVARDRSGLRAYTAADLLAAQAQQARAEDPVASELGQVQVRPVNLEIVRRRLRAAEGAAAGETQAAASALLAISHDNRLFSLPLPAAGLADEADVPLPGDHGLGDRPVQCAVVVDMDEPLLIITSAYRFLAATARQLQDLFSLGLAFDDLHPLASNEVLCAIARWGALREQERLVVVTMLGFARKYMTPSVRDRIEGPVPFSFDKPLAGWPFCFVGGPSRGDVTFVTASSRGLRLPMKEIPTRGAQILNKERDDLLIAAFATDRDAPDLLLLNGSGLGRRLRSADLYRASKAYDKGRDSAQPRRRPRSRRA